MKKKLGAILLVMVMAVALGVVPAATVGANGNLITNGGFEDGNTGFTTEYTYLDPSVTGGWTLGPEYMYTVSTDPSLYHSAWSSFGDHTSGTGNMMIVNGTWEDTSPGYNAVVWAQEVTDLTCVLVYPETPFALYAGQTWEIGEVLVKNDVAGKICVKFVLTDADAIAEGWLITEAHVAVGEDADAIPQTQAKGKGKGNIGGNPIPGQFEVNEMIDPGVTETDWFCLDYDWGIGEKLVIAAHAVVELPELGHWDGDVWVVDRPYDEESAWGGTEDFPGKNWATYITYDPQEGECDYGSYLLEFWAGNSYPGSSQWPAQPAILEVSINGTVVGTLALAYTDPTAPTPGWMQFSGTWDAGSATSANIVIRDTRHIMYGDDFVLDDISFVKQP